jgi:toluene monooxygenase system ferredoxin subunit
MQGDTEKFVKTLRAGVQKANRQADVRINKAGCFSQCGHGPMIVVYPENVWYAGVKESDLDEILTSHIIGAFPVERLRYEPGVKGSNKIETKPKETAPPDAGWKRLGTSKDVPANGMKEFKVDGVNVLVVNAGDAFFAYQALCPHEAVALEQGIHDGSVLTCLEHLWQFDIRTGAPLGDAEVGLKGYRLKEERGELYVELYG